VGRAAGTGTPGNFVGGAAAAFERSCRQRRSRTGSGSERKRTCLMSKILIIAEHDGASINPSTAKCVACASGLPDAEVDVAIFSNEGSTLAAAAASMSSVRKVLKVDQPVNEHLLAAILAPQVAAMAGDYSHIFGPSTTFGKDLMPRVAALLGVNQVSDIMSIEGSHRFKRPVYAGNAVLTVEAPSDQPVVATIRTASYQAVGNEGSAQVEEFSLDASIPDHTRFVELSAGKSDRPDLQTASTVVSGGRALGGAENFDIIYKLADALGAAVGASRAAVDAGYVPNEMQVGQTGQII